jgi:hypothetical protein
MSGIGLELVLLAAAVLMMVGVCYFESWSRSPK